ncbi:hypothetical protein ACFL54_04075 [Planctomycetota bacterium]
MADNINTTRTTTPIGGLAGLRNEILENHKVNTSDIRKEKARRGAASYGFFYFGPETPVLPGQEKVRELADWDSGVERRVLGDSTNFEGLMASLQELRNENRQLKRNLTQARKQTAVTIVPAARRPSEKEAEVGDSGAFELLEKLAQMRGKIERLQGELGNQKQEFQNEIESAYKEKPAVVLNQDIPEVLEKETNVDHDALVILEKNAQLRSENKGLRENLRNKTKYLQDQTEEINLLNELVCRTNREGDILLARLIQLEKQAAKWEQEMEILLKESSEVSRQFKCLQDDQKRKENNSASDLAVIESLRLDLVKTLERLSCSEARFIDLENELISFRTEPDID